MNGKYTKKGELQESGNGFPSKDKPSINEVHSDGRAEKEKLSEEEKKIRRQKLMNLGTAVSLCGIVFVGAAVFFDASSQWRYHRFQERVLGANFSQLNVSAVRHPCLSSGGHHKNPFADKLNEAQAQTSKFQSWSSMLSLIPAIVVITLFGASSDRIGRKTFFIVPIAGWLAEFVITWVVCYWHLELEWLLLGSAIHGVSGSYGLLFMAVYAYTVDNTDPNAGRTFGMVIVGALTGFFFSVSHVAVGYVIADYGYMWPIATGCMLVLIGLIGIILFLKETLQVPKDAPPYNVIKGVKSLFSFYVQKNPDTSHRRKDFILLLLAFVIHTMGAMHGINTLFLLNEPFCWNSKDIGYMETSLGIGASVIGVIILRVLQKHISDEMIVVVGLIAGIINRFLFAFAKHNWMIYLALVAELPAGNVWSLTRSILSKMVPANKIGSLLSSLAVIQVACSAASSAAIPQLYSHTVAIWKGLTYFVVGIIACISLAFLVAYIILKKRRERKTGDNGGVTTPSGDTEGGASHDGEEESGAIPVSGLDILTQMEEENMETNVAL